MDGHWLVKIEVSGFLLHGKNVAKEVDALEDIGLLDEAGAQNPVPGPVLVEGTLGRRQGIHRPQILVQKGIMLDKDFSLLIVREVDATNNIRSTS